MPLVQAQQQQVAPAGGRRLDNSVRTHHAAAAGSGSWHCIMLLALLLLKPARLGHHGQQMEVCQNKSASDQHHRRYQHRGELGHVST